MIDCCDVNPFPSKSSDLNFYRLQFVSLYRDPQLQVVQITMCLIWTKHLQILMFEQTFCSK